MRNIFLILLTTLVFPNENIEKVTVTYFDKTFEVVDCPDPKWKLSNNQICVEKIIDKNGNLLWEKSWTTNYRHGRWTKFHGNGKKLYEGLYNTGKKVGDWTEFYENGRIK